jgi:uncharacterized phiE125 gp8 family phage protein
MMALKLITTPATEPISLEEAMNFARIDSDADVVTLTGLITTARMEAEKITRRQLITATWEMRLDHFPGTIHLPLPPLQSVTSVKYLDYSGTEQTLVENTDYLVDTYSEPARVTPCYGMVWPTIYPVVGAVRIRFVAGYGDDDTDVPDSIRSWIQMFFGSMYENRELDIVANVAQAYTHLNFLDGLLDNYRVFGVCDS